MGFFRPHSPFVAPKKYFDLYNLADIPIAGDIEKDLEDVPPAALFTNPPNWGLAVDQLKEAKTRVLCLHFVHGCPGGPPARRC